MNAEMKVVAGAARTFAQWRFVFTEINEGGFYRGDTPYDVRLAALKQHGFALKALGINRHRWGNAFLVGETA